MAQLALFDAVPVATPATARRAYGHRKPVKLTIEQRFEAFSAENPHVMQALLRLARARLGAGERRIAVKALWEELRKDLDVAHDGRASGAYKLNNDFTAMAARELVRIEPALADVIELRKRKKER